LCAIVNSLVAAITRTITHSELIAVPEPDCATPVDAGPKSFDPLMPRVPASENAVSKHHY